MSKFLQQIRKIILIFMYLQKLSRILLLFVDIQGHVFNSVIIIT